MLNILIALEIQHYGFIEPKY